MILFLPQDLFIRAFIRAIRGENVLSCFTGGRFLLWDLAFGSSADPAPTAAGFSRLIRIFLRLCYIAFQEKGHRLTAQEGTAFFMESADIRMEGFMKQKILLYALILALALSWAAGCGEVDANSLPPALIGAVVENAHPDKLILSFSKAVTADGPEGWTLTGGPAFSATVAPAGLGTAKWTITLAAAAGQGQTLTIAYDAAVGSAADLAGNPLISIPSFRVTNNVGSNPGPVDPAAARLILVSAKIQNANPNKMILIFSKPATIDTTVSGEENGGWSLHGQEGITFAGQPEGLGTAAWTVSLSKAAVAERAGGSIHISYNNPQNGKTTSLDGTEELNDIRNQKAANEIDSAPDTTKPTLNAAFVQKGAPDKLILYFSEPVIIDDGNGYTLTGVSFSTNQEPEGLGTQKLRITLSAPVTANTSAAIAYTKGDTRDPSGNFMDSFAARPIVIGVGDDTRPILDNAKVLNSAPNKLILTFSEPVIILGPWGNNGGGGEGGQGWGIWNAAFDMTAEPAGIGTTVWTVTLSSNAAPGQRIELFYSNEGVNDDNAATDLAGNRLGDFENRLAANSVGGIEDTTPPELIAAYVRKGAPDTLVLMFSEPVTTDEGAAWTLTGAAFSPTARPEGIGDREWRITLTAPVAAGQAITITYDAAAGDTRDTSGNRLASITTPLAAANGVGDNTPPALVGAVVENAARNQLVLTFSEGVITAGDVQVDPSTAVTVTGAAIDWTKDPEYGGSGSVMKIWLTANVTAGAVITFSYDGNSGLLVDYGDNPLPAIADFPVTNNVQ